jgi:hypothetical protein
MLGDGIELINELAHLALHEEVLGARCLVHDVLRRYGPILAQSLQLAQDVELRHVHVRLRYGAEILRRFGSLIGLDDRLGFSDLLVHLFEESPRLEHLRAEIGLLGSLHE